MTPTPETDAAILTEPFYVRQLPFEVVKVDVCEKLERERDEAKAQLKMAYNALLYIATMPEYDQDDCQRLRNIGMRSASKIQPFIK
jgi:hypothetical protein